MPRLCNSWAQDRADHLASYATESRLVFGPRTAYRTPTGRVQEDGQPGPLRNLVGQRLLNFDGLRPGLTVRAGGYEIEAWAESYEPIDANVLIAYDDGPLSGQAAVTRNGNAISIGAWSAPLVTSVLEQVLAESGVPTVRLPEGVRRGIQRDHRDLDELLPVRADPAGWLRNRPGIVPIPGIGDRGSACLRTPRSGWP